MSAPPPIPPHVPLVMLQRQALRPKDPPQVVTHPAWLQWFEAVQRYQASLDSGAILADGTVAMAGNLDLGGFKAVSAAAASSNGDLLRYEQLFGVVTPAELGYLAGVTSGIQAQIDAVSAAAGACSLVQEETPSGAASVTLTLGTKPLYLVTGWLLPASDAILFGRVGVSGSIQSGAADYAWRTLGVAGGTGGDLSDSELQISGTSSIESTAASGGIQFMILIPHPSQTTIRKRFWIVGPHGDSVGNPAAGWLAYGEYIGALSAIDRFQLLFPSVNCTGSVQLWGFGS